MIKIQHSDQDSMAPLQATAPFDSPATPPAVFDAAQKRRHDVYRSFADRKTPNERLVEDRREPRGTGSLLRCRIDAYVDSGFMTPDPSGMRGPSPRAADDNNAVPNWHKVNGTCPLIRESAIGFPAANASSFESEQCAREEATDRRSVRPSPSTRASGALAAALFPLMKFMYEYCTTFFDTRHRHRRQSTAISRCTSRCSSSSG